MKVEKLGVHQGPISEPCGRRVLTKGLIVSEPHATAKMAMRPQDEQLILHQIPPPMREMRQCDQRKDRERFQPRGNVLDATARFFLLRSENQMAIQ